MSNLEVLEAKGTAYAAITDCEGGCGARIRTPLRTWTPTDYDKAADMSFEEGKAAGLYVLEEIDPTTVRRRCATCGPF